MARNAHLAMPVRSGKNGRKRLTQREEPRMLRRKLLRLAAGLIGATALASLPTLASAQRGEPIKIGFSMSLTGPLAANGKQALLGAKIWEEEIKGKGGLIGRPVKLIFYENQSNASQ